MPRGGKRPGAGAPRGNLNAATYGEFSSQLRYTFWHGSIKELNQMLTRIRQIRERRHAAS